MLVQATLHVEAGQCVEFTAHAQFESGDARRVAAVDAAEIKPSDATPLQLADTMPEKQIVRATSPPGFAGPSRDICRRCTVTYQQDPGNRIVRIQGAQHNPVPGADVVCECAQQLASGAVKRRWRRSVS